MSDQMEWVESEGDWLLTKSDRMHSLIIVTSDEWLLYRAEESMEAPGSGGGETGGRESGDGGKRAALCAALKHGLVTREDFDRLYPCSSVQPSDLPALNDGWSFEIEDHKDGIGVPWQWIGLYAAGSCSRLGGSGPRGWALADDFVPQGDDGNLIANATALASHFGALASVDINADMPWPSLPDLSTSCNAPIADCTHPEPCAGTWGGGMDTPRALMIGLDGSTMEFDRVHKEDKAQGWGVLLSDDYETLGGGVLCADDLRSIRDWCSDQLDEEDPATVESLREVNAELLADCAKVEALRAETRAAHRESVTLAEKHGWDGSNSPADWLGYVIDQFTDAERAQDAHIGKLEAEAVDAFSRFPRGIEVDAYHRDLDDLESTYRASRERLQAAFRDTVLMKGRR